MNEEFQEPIQKQSNLKYAVIGIFLVGGAAAAWWFTKPPSQSAETVQSQQQHLNAPQPEPSRTMFDNGFEIVEEEPDAGQTTQTTQTTSRQQHTANHQTGESSQAGWQCSGEISVAQVRSGFGAHRGEVRQCYERKLRSNPDLSGTLQVRLKIGANGSVQSAQVGGSLRDADVTSCVRDRARTWQFASPTGGSCAVVSAPFSLSPQQ